MIEYEMAGSIFKKVFFIGHKESHKIFSPIDSDKKLIVGLFLGKLSSLGNLNSLLLSIFERIRVKGILIRPHPNRLFTKKINIKKVIPSHMLLIESISLEEDIKKCDLILTGNSTTQLEILLLGKAALFCREIEGRYYDSYEYIKDGLMICWDKTLTLKQINEFYSLNDRIKIKNRLNLTQTLYESVENFNNYVFRK